MKWIVIIAFLMIAASLGAGLFFLVRDKGNTRNLANALTVRVALSITLFLILMVSWYMGWIEPREIPLQPRQ